MIWCYEVFCVINLSDGCIIQETQVNHLDNPVWHSLNTVHAGLAVGGARAKRYPAAFSSLAGVEHETEECFAELNELVEPEGTLLICSPEMPTLPVSWHYVGGAPAFQMVCEKLEDCKPQMMEVLTADDVSAMTELVELTQPGPFSSRTIEFGTFYGIKDGGRLVAMAGERTKIPGHEEISAVCTHPDYQGRGMARALVHAVAQNIIVRGNVPYLHVKAFNEAGVRTYQSIGFKTRRSVHFSLIRPVPQ